MERRGYAVLLLALALAAACGGSNTPAPGTSGTIVAGENGSASESSLASAAHTWKGHAHLAMSRVGAYHCKGTFDVDLNVVVGSDGHISGSGTGGYSPYTCFSPQGPVTAPGKSADYHVTGFGNGDHLVFFIKVGQSETGMPPGWPNPVVGSFDIPISGTRARTVVHSNRSLGLRPGRLTLTVSLACTDCG